MTVIGAAPFIGRVAARGPLFPDDQAERQLYMIPLKTRCGNYSLRIEGERVFGVGVHDREHKFMLYATR